MIECIVFTFIYQKHSIRLCFKWNIDLGVGAPNRVERVVAHFSFSTKYWFLQKILIGLTLVKNLHFFSHCISSDLVSITSMQVEIKRDSQRERKHCKLPQCNASGNYKRQSTRAETLNTVPVQRALHIFLSPVKFCSLEVSVQHWNWICGLSWHCCRFRPCPCSVFATKKKRILH